MKLTSEQTAFLKAQPLGTARNKVGAALGLLQATQQELATAARITPADLSEIRNGKYGRRFALETAQRIARVFGTCTDDVFPPETHADLRRKAKARGGRTGRAAKSLKTAA